MTKKMGDTYYYGWIPILSYELHFDYLFSEFTKNEFTKNHKITKITGDEQNTLDKKLSKTDGTYYTYDVHDDVKNKKFKVVISFNDKKIADYILIFNKENNLEAYAAICYIDSKGLVGFKLEYPEEKYAWKEHEMIEQFYIIIKNLYHSHTHHKDEDLLLEPVPAKDKKDAIGEILKQYDEKIIKYLKRVKSSMPIERFDMAEGFDMAEELIATAEGEMTYASRFVNLFKENIENHEAYSFVFSNALQSINILANKIESIYTARLSASTVKLTHLITGFSAETTKLTHLITGFTLAIVALTVSISIDAVFKISEHTIAIITEHIKTQIILDVITYIINFISILWIFSCLLILIVTVYKLRGWIKEIIGKKSYKKSSKF